MDVSVSRAVALALLAMDAGLSQAQAVKIISAVTCAKCTVEVAHIATLAGVDLPSSAAMLARDSEGHYFIVDEHSRLLKVYGSDGTVLGQIGRRGGGPGEYELLRNVLLSSSGSVHVLDGMLSRRSEFTRQGKFVGSAPLKFQSGPGMAAVILPDDRIVVNVLPTRPRDAVLLEIAKDGKTIAEFDNADADPHKSWLHWRRLLVRSNGDLIVARQWTFETDVYSPSLVKKQSFVREADWAPRGAPQDEPSDGVYERPLTPQVLAMWEDADHLVWFQSLIPSRAWRAGPRMSPATTMPDSFATLAGRPRYETVLEAVDLRLGRVVTRLQTNQPLGRSLGGGYLARTVQDSAGNPSVEVLRVFLKPSK